MANTETPPFSLGPEDKVIIIGAGLSGIGMGSQLLRRMSHKNFEIYDKNSTAGGTWYQNHYPNLSCDTPSHFYSFSFNLNPSWSRYFASQPEILAYLHSTIAKFNLQQHIKLRRECHGARWDPDKALWEVVIRDLETNETYVRTARVLVTAVGVLSAPRGMEEIPGHEGYTGTVMHTSAWPNDFDWEGKEVVVVGNGCSANQVIPVLVEQTGARSVVQVYRSPQWVMEKGDAALSGWFKRFLRFVPFAARIHRLYIALTADLAFNTFLRTPYGINVRTNVEEAIRAFMQKTAAPKYHEILVPTYPFGAKRPVMDHGYLAATNNPKLQLVQSSKIRLDGNELVDEETGGKFKADVVVLANGFRTQELLVSMRILGKEGKELGEMWREGGGAWAYRGVSIPGFPNLFLISGPNTLPTGNSTLHGIECSITYIIRLLSRLLPSRFLFFSSPPQWTSMEPTQDATERYNEWVQKEMGKLVYTKDVGNWYVNANTGKNTLTWPGMQWEMWWDRCVKWVNWADWDGVRAGKREKVE